MEAVILIGIQGSGKTTFYLRKFFETHIRISLDMLKTRHRERALVASCLAARQPFIVDNTNVLASERAVYIDMAREAGFRISGYYFRTPLRTAIARNAKRTDKPAIPVPGVAAKYKRLQAPVFEEGFDELYAVDTPGPGEFVVTPLAPTATEPA